jgi:hypothetical protein
MKKSLAIITLIFLCFGMEVMAGGYVTSYVKTKDQVYFGQDVRLGLFNYRVVSNDGTVTKVRNSEVMAYTKDSNLYENLPVFFEDKASWQMLQFVTVKQGLSLYSINCYREKCTKSEYFVFKNGEFYLAVDQRNAKTVLPFFGIKVI